MKTLELYQDKEWLKNKYIDEKLSMCKIMIYVRRYYVRTI